MSIPQEEEPEFSRSRMRSRDVVTKIEESGEDIGVLKKSVKRKQQSKMPKCGGRKKEQLEI